MHLEAIVLWQHLFAETEWVGEFEKKEEKQFDIVGSKVWKDFPCMNIASLRYNNFFFLNGSPSTAQNYIRRYDSCSMRYLDNSLRTLRCIIAWMVLKYS